MRTFVRTPFNYDMWSESQKSGTSFQHPSKARQEFKEECDINTIIRNFGLGYAVPEGLRLPTYGDFTGVENYHDAINSIALARESFDELPADMRKKFNNDPGAFVDFCSDSKNHDQLVEMGLIKKPEPVLITPVTPVPTGVQLPVADSQNPA